MAERDDEEEERTHIAGGRGGGLQRRRTRRNSWACEKNQRRFLAHLAATGNVTLAAKRANMCKHTGYMRRQRDPRLAAEWKRARAEGSEVLRDMLSEEATQALGIDAPEGTPIDPAVRQYGAKLALTLLKLHDPAREPRKPSYGRPRARTADELRASINAKLDEAERRLKGGHAE